MSYLVETRVIVFIFTRVLVSREHQILKMMRSRNAATKMLRSFASKSRGSVKIFVFRLPNHPLFYSSNLTKNSLNRKRLLLRSTYNFYAFSEER